jgi:hypothetical protein
LHPKPPRSSNWQHNRRSELSHNRAPVQQLHWIRYFPTIDALRKGLAEFAVLYYASWLRERHGHKTPNQIRAEQKALATQVATEFKLAA